MTNTSATPLNSPLKTTPSSTWHHMLIVGCLLVLFGYFGFIRPAQRHTILLQDQCRELKEAVDMLVHERSTVEGSLSLTELLAAQEQSLASAEQTLSRMVELQQRLLAESESLVAATAVLGNIDAVQSDVQRVGVKLRNTLASLDSLTDVADNVDHSGKIAQRAEESLSVIDRVSSQLISSAGKLDQSATLLDSVDSLAIRVENSQSQVQRATERLADQDQKLNAARHNLEGLFAIQHRLAASAEQIQQARESMAQLAELQQNLIRAEPTIHDLQHMVVDVMLLQPAVDRAAQVLRPSLKVNSTVKAEEEASPSSPKVELNKQAEAEHSPAAVFTAMLLNLNWLL